MTSRWIFGLLKWQVDEFVCLKKQVDEFIGQRNYKLMNLYSKEITSWWIDRLKKWQLDEFVGHWNDMLMI